MRLIHKLAVGIALACMLFVAGCCCSGGLDDEDIDLNLPGGTHNEGGGFSS